MTCSICGTGGQLRRGWCEMHYRRWRRTGAPEGTGRTGRPRRGATTYKGAHANLARWKGSASDHSCVDGCGRRAEEWSYTGGDPAERFDGSPYSNDPDYYVARCQPCHLIYDGKRTA